MYSAVNARRIVARPTTVQHTFMRPYEVVVIFADEAGREYEGQACECASARDCLIYGNGVSQGLAYGGATREFQINVRFEGMDPPQYDECGCAVERDL